MLSSRMAASEIRRMTINVWIENDLVHVVASSNSDKGGGLYSSGSFENIERGIRNLADQLKKKP